MTPEQAAEFWQSLSPERRLALAKAAPKVAGKWERDGVISYRKANGEPFVVAGRTRTDGYYRIGSDPLETVQSTALGAIESACDAELIRLGYVLEDG